MVEIDGRGRLAALDLGCSELVELGHGGEQVGGTGLADVT